MSTTATTDVRKSVEVGVAPERAWAVFTEEMGTWWPLATHSISAEGETTPDGIVVEGRVGGTIYETIGEDRRTWGTVVEWDPPTRLSVEWAVTTTATTRWTATFTRTVVGTRVDLVHSGFEAHGDQADEMREAYGAENGWTYVLGLYAAAASPSG
jgi:uncharacterized protein YndB with AHSA1/START domain